MHVDAIYERRESVPVLVMPYRQGSSTGPAPGRVGSGRKYHVMRGMQGEPIASNALTKPLHHTWTMSDAQTR